MNRIYQKLFILISLFLSSCNSNFPNKITRNFATSDIESIYLKHIDNINNEMIVSEVNAINEFSIQYIYNCFSYEWISDNHYTNPPEKFLEFYLIKMYLKSNVTWQARYWVYNYNTGCVTYESGESYKFCGKDKFSLFEKIKEYVNSIN